ncbi:MAG: TauD/TfdA family dioxygenase, partial [Candidatus Dormibacteria bacterium]
MCNAGLIPERTQDPKRAFHLWSADGAVILVTNRTDAGGMLAGVQDVFGPRILVRQSPTTVASSTTPGHDAAASPHIDGYMSFGDYYPDLVFLLCERQAIAGGESYIVDGQRLLSAIAGDPSQRALSRFLWEVKLEQGRPAWVGSPKPVPSRRPVASRTCG